MRLGIGSYAYAWSIGVPGHPPPHPMTAFELLDKAVQHGVSVVQICDNLPLHAMGELDLERLARQAQVAAVQIEVGTRGIQPPHLTKYLDLAERFASPILRVVIDTAEHHLSLEEAIELIRPQLPFFKRAGVILAIENHDRFSAAEFREMLRRLGSEHVGICLDTVNSFGALEGPEVVVATLAPWTVSLQPRRQSKQRQGWRSLSSGISP